MNDDVEQEQQLADTNQELNEELIKMMKRVNQAQSRVFAPAKRSKSKKKGIKKGRTPKENPFNLEPTPAESTPAPESARPTTGKKKPRHQPEQSFETSVHVLFDTILTGEMADIRYLINNFIEKGVDVKSLLDQRDDAVGHTLLFFAARIYYKGITGAVTRYLIEEVGIDASHEDSSQQTAAFYAAREGNEECLKVLVSLGGININHLDCYEQSALFYAIYHGRTSTVIFMVEELNAEFDRPDIYAQTGILIAQQHSRPHIVKYLISKGASTKVLGDGNSRSSSEEERDEKKKRKKKSMSKHKKKKKVESGSDYEDELFGTSTKKGNLI